MSSAPPLPIPSPPRASIARAFACSHDDDHGDHDDGGAPTTATTDIVPRFTFDPHGLQVPCACSASAPSPMATSAVTPCPTAMQPSLHDPASPSPTPSSTGVTSSLRRQRSQASSPRPACRSTDRFLIGSASYACNSKPRNDLQHRSAGCVASADAKASIDPIVCPATSWGPDRFYIELVSPLDACALLFSHLTQLAAGL